MSRKYDLTDIGLFAGIGCAALVLIVGLFFLIAIPISLILGAAWNIVFPDHSVTVWVAYAATVGLMFIGSMFGR